MIRAIAPQYQGFYFIVRLAFLIRAIAPQYQDFYFIVRVAFLIRAIAPQYQGFYYFVRVAFLIRAVAPQYQGFYYIVRFAFLIRAIAPQYQGFYCAVLHSVKINWLACFSWNQGLQPGSCAKCIGGLGRSFSGDLPSRMLPDLCSCVKVIMTVYCAMYVLN